MSLATRCTSCGTVFRVVQDQLKVSEGWVRCGRCNEVFNALEGLFDLEREAPPPWPATAAGAAPSGDALEEAFAADSSDPALVDRIDAAVFGPHVAAADRASQNGSDAEAEPDRLAAASWDSRSTAATTPIANWDVERPGAPTAGDNHEPAPPPEFVRHAERAARWQSRGARTALGATGAVLALALATQAALHFRDGLAARWPAARPLLTLLCPAPACRIEPPRRIEDVSVESTALTKSAGGADAFRLAVTLRNRGALAVSVPSVDLSLTDSAGQLVARRALAPRDFQVASPVMQPGAEAALQLHLSAGTPRVTGYTVEIFYP